MLDYGEFGYEFRAVGEKRPEGISTLAQTEVTGVSSGTHVALGVGVLLASVQFPHSTTENPVHGVQGVG